MKPAQFAGLLLLMLLSTASAEPRQLQLSSTDRQIVLLELFTSEGCSSCPPAERWLGNLTSQPNLWTDFVPLAFHVDYWDYIGWRDRFASSTFSQRQRRYAVEGGIRSVYTPGVLQSGQEWRGWYRSPRPESGAANAGLLTLNLAGQQVSVAYRSPRALSDDLEVHIALLGMGLETEVKAGENDGRTLQHEFVVLGLATTPLAASGQRYAAELSLPDATLPAPRYAVAAWVSAAGSQAPLQAVGGYLDFPPSN